MSFFRESTLQLEAVPALDLTASGGAVLKMGVYNMGSNLKTILQTPSHQICVQSFFSPCHACPDFTAASTV